jgi:hypothetical protein
VSVIPQTIGVSILFDKKSSLHKDLNEFKNSLTTNFVSISKYSVPVVFCN